jgi:hypothetical protein
MKMLGYFIPILAMWFSLSIVGYAAVSGLPWFWVITPAAISIKVYGNGNYMGSMGGGATCAANLPQDGLTVTIQWYDGVFTNKWVWLRRFNGDDYSVVIHNADKVQVAGAPFLPPWGTDPTNEGGNRPDPSVFCF